MLEPLRIVKNWFTGGAAREANWDELADKVSAWALRTNNNLKQVGIDIGGPSYDFNNQGKRTQTIPVVTRISTLESQLAADQNQISGNMGLNLAAGVLKVVGWSGSDLSLANPGAVMMPKADFSSLTRILITSSMSIKDDAHASSDLANIGFGITETAHWAQDVPFFLYVVNRNDTSVDGLDGNSALFISRNPCYKTTPASSNSIGTTAAAPSTDNQGAIVLWGDAYTVADYTSLPCQVIGAVRMRWSTTTDDWTIQTLDDGDGVGPQQLDKTFGRRFTFPEGQNGAAAGTHFKDNGGTAPEFDDPEYLYTIDSNGFCYVGIKLLIDSAGTDGVGAVTALCSTPYSALTTNQTLGVARITTPSLGADWYSVLAGTTQLQFEVIVGGTDLTNANFNVNASGTMYVNGSFKAFDP